MAVREQPVRPEPIRQFILKTHSRCNLACTYCYLYAGQDAGWRDRPRTAAPGVAQATARRIAEHAAAHGLREVAVVLHGGEPLLAGAERLAADVEELRRTVPCTVHAAVQTNATLLTADSIVRLRDARIRIGVSLDGGRPAHNAARVDHAGRPAWPAAAAGLRLLARTAPDAYAGVLCVADLRHDPVAVYESLLDFAPPAIDLLLPHGNWTTPPPGLPAPADDPAPYGRWLTAVFDRWWAADRRETRVRLFEECIALLLGVPAATERLGLQPFTAAVVETDGSIEQVDSLKSAYEGAAATGMDVFHHSFDQVLTHPGVAARQAGLAALAAECRACTLVEVCGGGHYAHRYLAATGFRNRSVYCPDLTHLIRHIATHLTTAATPHPREAVR
ncbi:FxsB family cyclophane-forming radical SAM/SPASM peptide maturase [Actinacidiphila bryophytorum]|uniref:FxsB family cyclophane-forming radical SAM/SPASM peptide maturase n=1 Tax=Actinacidiphila bryophytorum TaxID=1436133 RepID=UPI002176AC28|nr:FxsB family cyclophane-forming radical SAM/SPASM peptide maturase [Actinacidiphila bryophytorum]UWE13968.1 FxsB family radical SAM/SPASM domain protein [Actinacidiphila bryophytorum]